MGALLKFTRFDTFNFIIFSKLSSGFSTFQSWKSPTASSSTEHKAVAFLICSMFKSLFFSSYRPCFVRAGGSFGALGEAGNSSGEENEEGLRERGMRCEQDLLFGFFRLMWSWEGDLVRTALFGEEFLGKSLFWWGQVFVGARDRPFVGEVVKVVKLVEGEVVEEVLVEVEVEVERKGLP